MKYAFIQKQQRHYPIIRLCEVLEISTSGYYAWIGRPESSRRKENRILTTKIQCLHKASRRTYGSPRIYEDLLSMGEKIGVNRVARLMKSADIKSKMARRFIITTNSRKTMAPAPDLLQRNFITTAPNKVWVTDTTFIPTQQGWLYLAVVLDLYSRSVIGWAMSDSNNTQLVSDALTMAIWRRGKPQGVIVHSDQGATYSSGIYQQIMKDHGLICSMSRRGECLDNAVAESFFGSLKTEHVDDENYRTRTEAKQSIFEYIEIFYNQRRRHSTLGYLSPQDFEDKYVA